MGSRKDQHNVGSPAKLRGQQTGFAGNPDKNREEMKSTPAVQGRREEKHNVVGDVSRQHIASDATTPSTNTPSTPAMNSATRSETGGATVFKRRLAKKRATS